MSVRKKGYYHRWLNTEVPIRIKALKAIEFSFPDLQKAGVIDTYAHSDWESIPQKYRGRLMSEIKSQEIGKDWEWNENS